MLPVLMVVLCVVFRVVPHPPNFAPVGAAAVMSGRTMSGGKALLLVAVAMFLGDAALARIHGYSVVSSVTPFVYGGFFVQTFLGRLLRSRPGGTIAAAGLGAVAFFLLSNFGVWLASGMYPRTLAGLGACFTAAIPFFGGTLAGDVVWVLILNGLYRQVAGRLEHRPGWVPVPVRRLAGI
ncbi:hypothetical protein CSB20_02755 [bacterium DOLZORAL124_64_63]|nr:MAG: hypothetical protein CSB20_02755 [bacterium DOLZORAL124_64_63]